jgi:hypothetical protein
MQYPTGQHFAGMPDDAGHHNAVMERLPAAGTPPDQTTQILADMLITRSCRNEYFVRRYIYSRPGILLCFLDPADDYRAAFSIILVGNQIAEYLRLMLRLSRRRACTQMFQFWRRGQQGRY